MNKSYFQMCMEFAAASRGLEKTLEKNLPAIKEILLAGKQVLKTAVQLSTLRANITVVKEFWKNGVTSTISSGLDGTTVGYNSVDGLH